MVDVKFEPSGRQGRRPVGETLLLAAGHLGAPLRQVCGGQANCTTCRVRVLEGAELLSPPEEKEKRRLPDERLADGWRLSCQTGLRGAGVVRLHVPSLGEWLKLNAAEQ